MGGGDEVVLWWGECGVTRFKFTGFISGDKVGKCKKLYILYAVKFFLHFFFW